MICSDTIFHRFSNAKYNRNVPINRTTAKVNKKPNSVKDEASIIPNSCIESHPLSSQLEYVFFFNFLLNTCFKDSNIGLSILRKLKAFNSINYFTKHSGIRLHIGEMGGRFYKACIKIQFTDDFSS